MGALQPVSNIKFCVDTLIVRDGKRLGRVRPDKEGYYQIPVAVLGIPTRNRTYYDVPEFVKQITGTESYVRKMIDDGTLYGEFGHPDLSKCKDQKEMLLRLNHIDEKNWSHHIKSLATGETLENGGRVIDAKVKPHGPYKSILQENLDDPNMNTAFSLRSIADEKVVQGVAMRTMRRLVTFDSVGASGYNESTKRFSSAVANENLQSYTDLSITVDRMGAVRFREVACESLTATELNDLFGTKTIIHAQETLTFLPGAGVLATDERKLRSLYHEMIAPRG